VNPLVEQSEALILERKLLRAGQRVLVAVSGGLDSTVLLNVLDQLAARRRWELTVAHFNHQLRGAASDADEQRVRKMARALGWPVVVGRGDVKKLARRNGLSLEMAARKLRHDFLAQAARKRKIPTIALAHHADDQLELFFLRIFRGAGSDGLAGMNAIGPSPSDPQIALIRPLLDQSKADLRDFARNNGVEFSEDASNTCLDVQRNRIRRELIPLLRAHYQPALARAVFRVMEVVGAEAEFARAAAASWLGKGGAGQGFDRLAVAVQRRVLRSQLFARRQPADFELIERLRNLPNQPFVVSPGCSVARDDHGHIQLQRSTAARFDARHLQVRLSKKQGRGRFNDLRFSWAISNKPGMKFVRQPNVECFDADKVGPEIRLRFWMAGDRFQPSGLPAAAKLQDLFTNSKVPQAERRQRVVAVTGGGEIFWVQGLRIGERFKLDHRTIRRLKWRWRQ
jgi:tRNA(Ile)-lysidine synthase